jgi:hypothetical protein
MKYRINIRGKQTLVRQYTPEEVEEMDRLFCAAMERAGYVKTGPRKDDYPAYLRRIYPEFHPPARS